jgi:4-amino-4-deoxy-L-arabinose transferase-like glycosyltransferase
MIRLKAGWVAALIAGLTTIVYLLLIVREEDNDVGLVVLVTAMIVGAAVAAAAGASTGDVRTKGLLLGGASGLFLSLGYLSLFSIGILLLIAGIVSTFAWVRAMAGAGAARGWPVLAFAFAVALPWALLLLPVS